jgi:hypothetical protein
MTTGRPSLHGFCVVTAGTVDTPELQACVRSWQAHATYAWPTITVQGVFGSVPAFAEGVRTALAGGAEIICLLHNDVRIDEDGWDARVWEHFQAHPRCGLAGFGGALGLGDEDIYQVPYAPQQLARRDFVSNMQDAEAHGRRERRTRRAVCFDGFSQIGRADFWNLAGDRNWYGLPAFDYLANRGVIHHAYDSWLGAMAARLGWEAWLIPVACHHLGGRTAVGDPAYHQWAADKGGDGGIWEEAHRLMYEDCRGILPLRID